MLQLFKYFNKKLLLIKNLFIFSLKLFIISIPPFNNIYRTLIALKNKIIKMQQKLDSLGKSQIPFNFLFQIHRQFTLIIIGIVALIIYLKCTKGSPKKSEKQTKKLSKKRELQQLSQKSILPIVKQQRAQYQIDSCCEQLHKNLNKINSHNKCKSNSKCRAIQQDGIFLAILRSYQHIDQKKPLQNRNNDSMDLYREEDQNIGQKYYLQDNTSTYEGNHKKGTKIIKNNHVQKKQQQLNRSSVL